MRGKLTLGIMLVAMPCIAWSADQPLSSKEQNAKFDQAFRAMDTNHTGKVSKSEAESTAPVLAENFEHIDENHDGGLTKQEIKNAFAAADKRRREFFQGLEMADKDGDGKMSREEAKALPNISANFDAIDSNHDQNLVLKEIADYVRSTAKVASSAGQPAK